jgi:uncharacterized protein YfaP (DUF2135 family)
MRLPPVLPALSVVSLLLAGVLAGGAHAEPEVSLRHPSGGWVYGGISDDPAKVEYAYPANLIERGGQRGRTLIEGHLRAAREAGRDGRTPVLVVNGNPMPLYTGADGRFARPYAFGPGSNGLEIRDAEGRSRKRVQFYEANRGKTSARVRVILAWDDPQAELDLHVITPDGQHAFWASPVLTNSGGLDVDSVDGAGPEMFSMAAPMAGTYHVYVNYWGNYGAGGYHFDESTRQREVITARITLVFDENTGAERRESFTVPMRKIGDLTLVRSFRRGA